MKAALLISHGSYSPKAEKEIIHLFKEIKALSGFEILEYAFLEIAKPTIPQGIDRCVRKGAQSITVLLNFLNSGKHVDEDIPRIIKEAKARFPHVDFRTTPPIGQHPKIQDLFLDFLNPKSD